MMGMSAQNTRRQGAPVAPRGWAHAPREGARPLGLSAPPARIRIEPTPTLCHKQAELFGSRPMNKNYLIYGGIAAAVVIVAAAGWWYFSNSGGPLAGLAATSQSVELKPTDMVHGKPDAKVTIIEYASMTCPHCAAFQKEVVPLLAKDYIDTGKVKLIFREYPLDGAARMASAVARCFSGDQYFSFIDLLFANQMNWIKDFDNNGQLTK